MPAALSPADVLALLQGLVASNARNILQAQSDQDQGLEQMASQWRPAAPAQTANPLMALVAPPYGDQPPPALPMAPLPDAAAPAPPASAATDTPLLAQIIREASGAPTTLAAGPPVPPPGGFAAPPSDGQSRQRVPTRAEMSGAVLPQQPAPAPLPATSPSITAATGAATAPLGEVDPRAPVAMMGANPTPGRMSPELSAAIADMTGVNRATQGVTETRNLMWMQQNPLMYMLLNAAGAIPQFTGGAPIGFADRPPPSATPQSMAGGSLPQETIDEIEAKVATLANAEARASAREAMLQAARRAYAALAGAPPPLAYSLAAMKRPDHPYSRMELQTTQDQNNAIRDIRRLAAQGVANLPQEYDNILSRIQTGQHQVATEAAQQRSHELHEAQLARGAQRDASEAMASIKAGLMAKDANQPPATLDNLPLDFFQALAAQKAGDSRRAAESYSSAATKEAIAAEAAKFKAAQQKYPHVVDLAAIIRKVEEGVAKEGGQSIADAFNTVTQDDSLRRKILAMTDAEINALRSALGSDLEDAMRKVHGVFNNIFVTSSTLKNAARVLRKFGYSPQGAQWRGLVQWERRRETPGGLTPEQLSADPTEEELDRWLGPNKSE